MTNAKTLYLPINKLDTTVIARAKYARSDNITAPATRRNLLGITCSYNDYLKDNKLKLTPKSIISFLDQLKGQQAPATWNLSRQNLKKVLRLQPQIRDNYLLKMLVEEIFRDIKPLRIDRKIINYLSRTDIERLADQSPTRLGLMIRFLFISGCRISELIQIRLCDIDIWQNTTIRIMGKGSKLRKVFIPMDMYRDIRKEFQGHIRLFETPTHKKYNRSVIWRQLKRAGNRILGREIYPHILRHSTANYLLQEKGKSANYVAEYLGHFSSSITLDMYIHEQIHSDIIAQFE
jgi:integrase